MSRPATTALRRWRSRTGKPWAWLAERAGVAERTVRRAAAGTPIGAVYAKPIADAAGLRLEDLAVLGEAPELTARRSR